MEGNGFGGYYKYGPMRGKKYTTPVQVPPKTKNEYGCCPEIGESPTSCIQILDCCYKILDDVWHPYPWTQASNWVELKQTVQDDPLWLAIAQLPHDKKVYAVPSLIRRARGEDYAKAAEAGWERPIWVCLRVQFTDMENPEVDFTVDLGDYMLMVRPNPGYTSETPGVAEKHWKDTATCLNTYEKLLDKLRWLPASPEQDDWNLVFRTWAEGHRGLFLFTQKAAMSWPCQKPVCPAAPSCPDGQLWDTYMEQCVCAPDGAGKECGPGQEWDEASCQCSGGPCAGEASTLDELHECAFALLKYIVEHFATEFSGVLGDPAYDNMSISALHPGFDFESSQAEALAKGAIATLPVSRVILNDTEAFPQQPPFVAQCGYRVFVWGLDDALSYCQKYLDVIAKLPQLPLLGDTCGKTGDWVEETGNYIPFNP